MPPTEVGDLAGEHRTVGADRERVAGSSAGELVYERRIGAFPVRAPGVERDLRGRRRAFAAQGGGGRGERLAQFLRQGALGVGDSPSGLRSLRQALEQKLRAAETVAHPHLCVVALRGQRRALAYRHALGPRAGERVAEGLAERAGVVMRRLAQLPDSRRERVGGVGER